MGEADTRTGRSLGLLAGMLAACAVAATLWILAGELLEDQTLSGQGLVPVPVSSSGPIDLIDQDGRSISQADFEGGLTLVYFGYTHCPDLCPTALQTAALAIDHLGAQGARVTPLFISVDPDRDPPTALKSYVGLFHPRLVGATGTKAQIDAVARAFKVTYALRTDIDAADYPVDHSTRLYLMDETWRLAAVFAHDASAGDIAAAIRRVL